MREARSRIPGLAEVHCAREGQAYHLRVERGAASASGKLKAQFWEEHLASGRADHCGCVDHFFEHLERQLG